MKNLKNIPIAIAYYGIIIPISLLPFPILYLFSDFLYLILYKVVGYRKKVVHFNLKNSFPEKHEFERKKIEKQFYKHLCDVVVESLKSFTISNRQISKRMKFLNPEVANQYAEQGRSVILVGGHYGNWEWIAISISQRINFKVIGIYQPIKNEFFNQKINSSRGKFGLLMISTKIVPQTFEKYKNELTATIFAMDQAPGNPQKSYWLQFLNQDTATIFGPEKYATQYNYPVIYGDVNRTKRGYYEVKLKVIIENPTQTQYGDITTICMQKLEKTIQKRPEQWLWSHKRWKHKR